MRHISVFTEFTSGIFMNSASLNGLAVNLTICECTQFDNNDILDRSPSVSLGLSSVPFAACNSIEVRLPLTHDAVDFHYPC